MAVSSISHQLPSVRVGTARCHADETGVTAILFDGGAMGAVDARGGAVSSIDISALDGENVWGEIDALVFAGGSSYGLGSVAGVMRSLFDARRGSVEALDIPAVPGAVVYDFEGRSSTVWPDADVGAQAAKAAKANHVDVGRVGAGSCVHVGTYFGWQHGQRSGQGSAFSEAGGARFLAVVVVNSLGNIRAPDGRLVAGFRPHGKDVVDITDHLDELLDGSVNAATSARGASRNTTLCAVITDVALNRPELRRLAVMVSSALARIIDPFAGPEDGDVVFALSTGTTTTDADLTLSDLGLIAGRCAQNAVLSVFE